MKSLSSSSCVSTLVFLLLITTTRAQPPATFKCSSNSSCQALIDYVPINSTTYSDIKTLFGVKNLRSIFGANSLPLSTSPNETVTAKQHIKIPFPCICNNDTGISNKRPVYRVKEGDGLDFIARTIFSNLMTYQQIATVNRITDPNKITTGQELVIPLPCSCDEVDGVQVVHYGHVVSSGSTVQAIAAEYGTTQSTLLRLNGLASADDLLADSVIDVPLQACTSVISNTSSDYPLLVPNGTYTFTANNCVQCTCAMSNNIRLECVPSPEGVKTPKQCPSMQCSSGLSLGSASSATCGNTTCSYAGYTNDTNILTTLVGDPGCPNDGAARPSNNGAPNIVLPWWNWSWLLISLGLGMLGSGLLW